MAAERLVLARSHTLVIRSGLAIGASADGRSGHLDWLRYRTERQLPVTIIEDESRSAVWAEALATRIMTLAQSAQVGIRHVHTTRAVSRVELATCLMSTVIREVPQFKVESRHQQAVPHLGRIALDSQYHDEWSSPLPSVVNGGEIASCPM